jgi:spore germination protein YaaH
MQNTTAFGLIFGMCCALACADTAPLSVHQAESLRHQDAPVNAALLEPTAGMSTLSSASDEPVGLSTNSRPCATVFGYLPYWENPTPLRWDLLTHVACFSVEVNQFGHITNTRGWPWWNVINEAHANGVKVVLVATLFDGAQIETLINTPAYKQSFFVNIRNQLLLGNADGLNIDFENGTQWQDDINGFMADLSAYLKAEIPGIEISIAGPAVNWADRWDLVGLAEVVDAIFIMGYQFAGGWSSVAGANAPLTGGSINITDTVDVQYAGVRRDRLILGVPYYGHHWQTFSSGAGASVRTFVGSTRFFNDEPNAAFYGKLWDANTQTPWYRWFANGTWNQVWYDDAESLGLKYQLAIDRGLQGVGMWALGYDEGRDELWDQLELQFGGCGTPCDFDDDGDCDGDDMVRFLFCMRGPERTYGENSVCWPYDMDGDQDVDMEDLQLVLLSWQ